MPGDDSILDKFADSFTVRQVHINLNKQSMVTKNWERDYLMMGDHLFRHFYKHYMIFLTTRDDALVQISGCNIFVFLNDKFGRGTNSGFQKKEEPPAGVIGPDPKQIEKPIEPPKVTINTKCHKYNLKNSSDSFKNNKKNSYWDDIVNRNRLFYCTH